MSGKPSPDGGHVKFIKRIVGTNDPLFDRNLFSKSCKDTVFGLRG